MRRISAITDSLSRLVEWSLEEPSAIVYLVIFLYVTDLMPFEHTVVLLLLAILTVIIRYGGAHADD